MTQLQLVIELRDILRGVRTLEQQIQATAKRLQAVQEQLEADDKTPRERETG